MENATMDRRKAVWLATGVPQAYRSFSEAKVTLPEGKAKEIADWFEGIPERQRKVEEIPQHPDYGQSLWINSDYHMGKTRFVIAAMFEHCLKYRKAFRWTEAVDYIDAQRLAMATDDDESSGLHRALQAVEAAKSTYFLILDEIGEERYSDWVDNELLRLVKARFKAGRPTVLITQLTQSEWKSTYSSPLTAFVQKNCHRISI
ncbi:ATP-binding protein [Streptomyces goshikiensis]|uniref:ATP-binding protein n=1 Tax=Streptomyces goshikiensis TaxID=1942 RepID=UPI00379213AB